jgi:hypothetical protein
MVLKNGDEKIQASLGVTYTLIQKATFTYPYQDSGTFGQIHPSQGKVYIVLSLCTYQEMRQAMTEQAKEEPEEKHKYKRLDTIKYPGGLFRRPLTKYVIFCTDCGDIKVVEL